MDWGWIWLLLEYFLYLMKGKIGQSRETFPEFSKPSTGPVTRNLEESNPGRNFTRGSFLGTRKSQCKVNICVIHPRVKTRWHGIDFTMAWKSILGYTPGRKNIFEHSIKSCSICPGAKFLLGVKSEWNQPVTKKKTYTVVVV